MGPRKKPQKKLTKDEQAELERLTIIYELYDSTTQIVDRTFSINF